MRNISNSEVTCWLSCRRQYKYAHVINIEPKETGDPLYRGTLGHEAFQRYAEARIDGASHDTAMRAGQNVFLAALKGNSNRLDLVMETRYLWDRYMQHHNGWPEWKLLSVEKKFELPLNEEMNITIRYDAMVNDLKTGRNLIVDYKFTYDFWSQQDHDLNGQMPKYIAVMNANGIEVHGGLLEEIRTRKLGEEKSADFRNLWRRTAYFPSNAKKMNMLRQHIVAGLEIIDYRNLPTAEQEARSIPVLNKHGACKYCNFKDLCNTENDGGDISHMVQIDYVPNTYGYNTEEKEVQAL